MNDDTRPDLPGGTYLTPEDRQAAARDIYRESALAGTPLHPTALAEMFERGRRWADQRIAEVRAELNGTYPEEEADPMLATPAGTPSARNPDADHGEVVPVGMEPAGAWARMAIRWVTTVAVIGVAACAARASYDHQRRFVEMAGEAEAAWYLPLSVDGMMLVASLNMLVRRWDNQPAGWLTWCALVLGGIASLAANVAAAEPTLIGRVVAGWPPVCLIVSYELLMQQLPSRRAPEPAIHTAGEMRADTHAVAA